MKYAIVGPRGRVFKVLDEPRPLAVEISEDIANQIANTKDAILIDGVVTNHLLEKEAGFRLKWNDETKSWNRIAIVKPVPSTITAVQIRLWLVNNGISMDMVYSAIEAISDPQTKAQVSVLWEYAPYIERSNPFVTMLGQTLGLNDEAIDQAFREAKVII